MSLHQVPLGVIQEHLIPQLDAVSRAQFAATCRRYWGFMDPLHLISVRHPSEIPLRQLAIPEDLREYEEGYDELVELGYCGEGQIRAWDALSNRYFIMNDFYALGYRSREHWLGFVDKMKKHREFDFRWRFYQFPTLPGTERLWIRIGSAQAYTLHRGSCIMITWKRV